MLTFEHATSMTPIVFAYRGRDIGGRADQPAHTANHIWLTGLVRAGHDIVLVAELASLSD